MNSKISLPVGTWSMVSVSWGAASVSFHLNGNAVSKTVNTPTGWSAPGPALDPALTLGPGTGAGGTSLDEVAIFPAALTKAEIAAHYAATLLPTVLSAPVLSPLTGVRAGDTLTLTPASYTGATGSRREWQRCDTNGACTAIAGVTGTSYTLTAADVDHSIQVEETASNATGSISVISDATDPVLAAPTITPGDPGTTTQPTTTPSTTAPTTSVGTTCSGRPRLLASRHRSVRVGGSRVTLRLDARRRRAIVRARRGSVRSVAFKWAEGHQATSTCGAENPSSRLISSSWGSSSAVHFFLR